MDISNLLYSAGAVIFGALVSVVISTIFARREEMRKTRVLTTLALYTQYQSNEMVTARNNADKILKENAARDHPLSYNELYNTLPVEQYDHIARILYFFTQIADLYKLHYLEEKLANATFARYFKYWHETHFHGLWEISHQHGEPDREWVEPMNFLARKLNLNRTHTGRIVHPPEELIGEVEQISKQTA